MYSKTYWIGCADGEAQAMIEYYDSVVTPAVQASDVHIGHHMIQTDNNRWLLVSNYVDQAGAESALGMVQDLVAPMMQKFGMTLEPLAEGEAIRAFT